MKAAIAAITTGIVAWCVGLVIAIAVGASSEKIYTCIVGALLGLIGLRYTIRRAKREGWNQLSICEAMPRKTFANRSASGPDGERP